MKLLLLIACLLIERYLHIGGTLRRFSWFEHYLTLLQKKIGKDSIFSQGLLGIIIVILPVWLPVAIFYVLAVYHQYALSGTGLYFLVLLYCFGPSDLFNEITLYFSSLKEQDLEHQAYSFNEITGSEMSMEESQAKSNARKLTEAILVRANCAIFAVIFWYCVGGILMVVVYRIVCIMAQLANQGKEVCEPFAEAAIRLYGWLDWLPARATALLYFIAGGARSYSVWKQCFWSKPSENRTILIKCGVNAIAKEKELLPLEENEVVVALIDRALVIFVAIMIAFTLGGWLK